MSDVIVVGGGVMGMLTARQLLQRGVSVTLIEKSDTGNEASWAGGGIVSPLYPWNYVPAISALASSNASAEPRTYTCIMWVWGGAGFTEMPGTADSTRATACARS